jgi:hypothetical protein
VHANTLASIVPPGSAALILLITVLIHFASSVVLGVLAGAEAILDAECFEVRAAGVSRYGVFRSLFESEQ